MGLLALNTAILAATVWFLLSLRRTLSKWATWAAAITTISSAVAIGSLANSLARIDPALTYVARHSSRETPLAYRLAGVWGGMEGSLLFWSLLVAATVTLGLLTTATKFPELRSGLSLVGAALAGAFLVIVRLWASPFDRLDVPTGMGQGLLGVLQHPAMIYHPPLLYSGLVLLCVPFGLTASAVARRAADDRWLHAILPWLRASWLLLGLGMLSGSQWAYAELGWGGFWAWDPVENAALVPWLITTIVLHSAQVTLRTGRTAPTTAVSVAIAFLTMITGVYVTRSGGTGSIHAFSEAAKVGRAVFIVAAVFLAVSILGLMRLRPTRWQRLPITAEHALGVHAVLIGTTALAIGVGTFLPVASGLFGGQRFVVVAEYYERALVPIVIVILIAMTVGPRIHWQGGIHAPRRLLVAGATGIVGVALWIIETGLEWNYGAGLVLMSAAIAIAVSVTDVAHAANRRSTRRMGVALAHGGIAMVMLAAAAASLGSDVRVNIAFGEPTIAGQWSIKLLSLDPGEADRYQYVRAEISLIKWSSNDNPSVFWPELRAYGDQPTPTSEASIKGGIGGDVTVVLDSIGTDLNSATIRVLDRPLLPWVWWGSLIMLLGGLLVLLGDRLGVELCEPDAERRRRATEARPL